MPTGVLFGTSVCLRMTIIFCSVLSEPDMNVNATGRNSVAIDTCCGLMFSGTVSSGVAEE
jgi:hypothetical protein